MQKRTLGISICVGAVLIVIGLVAWYAGIVPTVWAPIGAGREEVATTTTEAMVEEDPAPTSGYYKYGAVTLPLNKAAGFESGSSMRVLEVLEDSRCPKDVQCIQAGTVRLSIRTTANGTTETNEIRLGESIRRGVETITFASVWPDSVSTEEIAPATYRFTFEVSTTPAVPAPAPEPAQGQCYVGGCSSQLCSDRQDMVSTCEFRAEYACYRTATCERQTNGTCGWTQTAELKACVANPPAL